MSYKEEAPVPKTRSLLGSNLHGVKEIDGPLTDAYVSFRLESVDDCFLMLLDGLVGKFGDGE